MGSGTLSGPVRTVNAPGTGKPSHSSGRAEIQALAHSLIHQCSRIAFLARNVVHKRKRHNRDGYGIVRFFGC